MKKRIYHKRCNSSYKMKKEAAVLNFLSKSAIHDFIPKIAFVNHGNESLTLSTYVIDGLTPSRTSLNCGLMHSFGVMAKRVHQIECCRSFGSLSEDMVTQKRFEFFSEFIESKIQKWATWHRESPLNNSYILDYCDWISQEIGVMRKFIDHCHPLFCHGDFDLKNILVRANAVIGLLDWEHAGMYCLEWELRKLSPFWRQHPEFLFAFYRGYFGKKPDNYLSFEKRIFFMEAIDLLGHLRWCVMRNMEDEYANTIFRMHHFLSP